MIRCFQVGRREVEVEIRKGGDGWLVGDREIGIEITGDRLLLSEGKRKRSAYAVHDGNWWWIWLDGIHFRLRRKPGIAAAGEGAHAGEAIIQAPMTGRILRVRVQAGDRVAPGSELLQMEAMKMVYTLSAPVAGTVQGFSCRAEEVVEADQVLGEIVPFKEDGK
ncbi:MAG: hypothetical protein O6947_00930 [Acidobacteria bacterium]|nr:hypothetical protein [Acidobacteriota bacterium]